MKNDFSVPPAVLGSIEPHPAHSGLIDSKHPAFGWASRIFLNGVDVTPLGITQADLPNNTVLASRLQAGDPRLAGSPLHTLTGHIDIEFKTALWAEGGMDNLLDLFPELAGHIYQGANGA